jgi:hypothetical protein
MISNLSAFLVQWLQISVVNYAPAALAGNRGGRQEAFVAPIDHQGLHLAPLSPNTRQLFLGWVCGAVGGIRRQGGPINALIR